MQAKKTHYSASQINQFMRCSAQWFFRYVEGLKIPPTGAMAQGRAYHKGLETNYKQKIESHNDMPVADVKDAFSTAFDTEIALAELDADEAGKEGEMKDAGIRVTEEYLKTVSPGIQPTAVEHKINIDFDNVDYEIVGFIDLIDDKNVIHDHKLTSRSPSKDKTDQYMLGVPELIQGAVYCLAMGTSAVSFDYAVKNKTPKIIQIPTEIDSAQKNFVLGLTGQIDHAIKNGVFIPNRSSFMCSKKMCGYHEHCELMYGGRVKD